jgi:dihydroorotate dehydrogenase
MYRLLIKPVLFLFNPEKAHHITFALLDFIAAFSLTKFLFRSLFVRTIRDREVEIMGLKFRNRLGIAAGLDKDGKHIKALEMLGFGHVEVGTVTPKPQPGNDKPRLFRLPADEALINRMGFNNHGADALALRLKKLRQQKLNIIIGGNIGKNKVTPNEKAVDDYVYCFCALFDVVDYFVVNVSSPNTPGLRELQDKEPLTLLLSTLQKINRSKSKPKPVLLKIAPDLSPFQLDVIIDIVKSCGLSGIIATNTTISRDGLTTDKTEVESIGAGGLSGKPLLKHSTEVLEYIGKKAGNELVLIGVGGVHTGADAVQKIGAGAQLVQVYTGLIYEGPSMVRKILNAL